MVMREYYTMLNQSFLELLDRYAIHEKTVSVKADGGGVAFGGGATAVGAAGAATPADGAGSAGSVGGASAVAAGGISYTPEVKLTARYEGAIGECYSCCPGEFTGTLSQIAALDIEGDPVARSIYIAATNAVMNKYELADECLSCDEADERRCAEQAANQYKRNNGKVNVLLAGYQPHMMETLAARFPLRVLDLDPENIGKTFFGVTVEDGKAAYADATRWAEVILCSGSSLANGTFFDYAKLPKDVAFYGTTIAGAARVFGLKRLCPFGRNS
jgi:hypothetical protein